MVTGTSARLLILLRLDEDIVEWPILRDDGGQRVLMFFTSEERIRDYKEAEELGPEWVVGEMEPPDFLIWLRHNLRNGVGSVLVDPGPGADASEAEEILRVLIEAEA